MALILLLKGILIGLLIACPIGPIDLLCIRNSLVWGLRAGFITGLGAAFADAIYGAIAAFGISSLTAFLLSYKLYFQIYGSLVLCMIGFKIFRSNDLETDTPKATNLQHAFLLSFFLALTSPMTILSFIGAFFALGVGFEKITVFDMLLLTLGVFLGSSLWWLILSSITSFFRVKLSQKYIQYFSRATGILLVVCGIAIFFL